MPSDSAAKSTMRLVNDLDPGKITEPLNNSTGAIVNASAAKDRVLATLVSSHSYHRAFHSCVQLSADCCVETSRLRFVNRF